MSESLKVEVLEVGPYFTNCYLVSDETHALLIDPGDDSLRIEQFIEKNNALTHGHIDHISALPHIKEITGAPVLIHSGDAEMLTDAKANLSAFHSNAFTADAADGFQGQPFSFSF